MDLRQQARNVANQGRYGDSMLLHVNPVEMKGLASAMPLTINPQTGQPEAFLPFLAPILGSVLGKALLPTIFSGINPILASAVGSGLAQTAATGDVKKGLLAGLTGFGVGQFLDKIGPLSGQIGAQEATKTALQQSGVPLTGEIGTKAIQDAGAQGLQRASETAASQIFKAPDSDTIGDILGGLKNPEGSALFSKDLGANVLLEDVVPSGLEVGTKATLEALSDPMVYIPAGVGMGTTGQMISQEEFERYMANAPEREKERIRQLMAMYPEAIPMQEGGFLNDPLIYEAGRALALDEINKRTRRQMTPEEKAAYERAFRLYEMNTESGMESRPDSGKGNGQFDGGEDDPLIRRANPIPQGFMGGFAPEFSYFSNVNPSATDLQTGASQAGLSGQRGFTPQAGSGVQLANRDLSANLYADAYANAIPDLTPEQRQQARNYAFQVEMTGDTSGMPSFLDSKEYVKGIEAGNKVRSQVQANPNQFGIATPGQFSPTQTAGYRQFYGSSGIGVPQVIDPFSPFQGFSVSPFTPSALTPPIAPIPPSAGTDPDKDPERNGGQRGEEDTGTGQGDQTKDETRDAGTETRFLPDLTRDQFDLMLQGQEDYADLRRRFENILGVPEAPKEDTPIADAPVADTPDYAQQLADQAQLIQQLQEQIASNQAAISGIPSIDTSGFLTQEDLSSAIAGIPQFDPSTISFSDIQGVPDFATTDQLFDPSTLDLSGFATTDDLSTAISGIPSFDPSALQSDISGLQTGLAGLQGQFQGFTPFDPTAIQNQLAALQEAQLGFASDIGGLQNQAQGFTPFDPSNIASQISDLQTGLAGLQGQFQGFTPSPTTISFDDIQGVPDFSQFATQTDLSNIPQFDPSNILSQLSDLQLAQAGLEGQFQGFSPFDPTTIQNQLAALQEAQLGFSRDLGGLQGEFRRFTPSPTTINFSEIQGAPDFSQFATTQDLSNIPQFDPTNLQEQIAALQRAQTGLEGQFQGFTPTPTTINFSDIQGIPDFSQFATQDDLSSAISGVPQFDPSTLDLSRFATTEDLSSAISGIPQFDPSNILSQLSDLTTGQRDFAQDLGNLQGQFSGFTPTPTTINFSDIQGVPDFSQFATTQDLSTAVSGIPQFDPSTLGLPDFSQFATTEDLSSAISGIPQFDPSSLDLPDFSKFATTDQLFDPSTLGLPDFSQFATTQDLSTAIRGVPQFDPTTINFSDIQGTPDFNQFATTQDLSTAISGVPQFDPSAILSQLSNLQTGQRDFAKNLGNLQGQFEGFTPSPTTINFSDIQGAPDLSNFATRQDLSTAISGVPQFDPSTLDLSRFATTDDLSTAISGISQFDPSNILSQLSNLQTGQTGLAKDVGNLQGQFSGFTPSPTTINFSEIQGAPDFSQFATQDDLSTAISGVPQFDPSTLGLPDFSQFATQDQLFDPSTLDFSNFATTQDLSSAISGVPQFDPSSLNLPDFSQFATRTDLSNIPQFDPSGILSQLGNLQKAQTGFAQDLGGLQGQFEGFTPTPTTINFGDIQGVPDFSNFATTDDLSTAISGVPQFDPSNILSQLGNIQRTQTGFAQDLGGLQGQFQGFTPFDPSTLNLPDFNQFATTDQLSNFATTDQLFNPSSIQAQIDALQGLLDQQGGTSQAETYGPTVTPGPQTMTSPKSAPVVGRSDGGNTKFPDLTGDGKVTQADILKGRGVDLKSGGKGLKLVPEDNKGLAKLPEEVRNKMGFMAPGGDTSSPEITQAMLDDPLTSQVAQFILGNETNDEVVSAFIDKYGSNAFREIRRAVLKTLAPNAQTEGMIKGSLAGGMEDDIFGVIGDPNKNGQRVAVSQDEFIVPADVVSMLGDGSSDAGANKLERMMNRIRTEKTNTTKQARPINDKRVLPA